MQNKKRNKLFTGCALSMALAMAVTPINVLAAEGDPPAAPAAPASGSSSGINPTAEDYAGTDIDVWAFTKEETVYSVDVEWGAMTFQYETGRWDPDTHTMGAGRGWLVYDNENSEVKVLDNNTPDDQSDDILDVQDAINRVTVTNHSNAAVYAKLTYTDGAGSDTFGTTGTFAASADNKKTAANTATDFNASFDATNGIITLQTADNGTGGAAGTPTKGNVYFKPSGITADTEIAELSKIGKITVTITTTDPTPAP